MKLQLDVECVDEQAGHILQINLLFSDSELQEKKDTQDVIMNNIFDTWKETN